MYDHGIQKGGSKSLTVKTKKKVGDTIEEKLSDGSIRQTNNETKEITRKSIKNHFVAHSKNGSIITDHKKTGLRY